jgi:phage replication O-like protein O
MANPQKENGYTPIANEIMDALIAFRLSGQELRITLLIIRKTYGFNKKEDPISLSQMIRATGLCKIRCSQVINRLELMKIVTVTENINGIGKKYKFNKDFDKWHTVNENCNRYRKTKETVNVLINQPLMKTVTTKDNITKDSITKDNIYCRVVTYLNNKTNKNFKHTSKETQKLIKARLSAGFTEKDFFTVINNKVAKWLNDPKMSEYLRPQTLFGTKFESYLQDVPHPLQNKVSAKTIKNIEILENWRPKDEESENV